MIFSVFKKSKHKNKVGVDLYSWVLEKKGKVALDFFTSIFVRDWKLDLDFLLGFHKREKWTLILF